MAEENMYKIGHQRPDGSIAWLDTLYTAEEAERQCAMANYAESGGRTLQAAGHSATERQDSGFRWIYELAATIVAIEDRDRDWSHALKEAVEAQFPEWGDFHEWPATPDVGAVCDWLGRLIKAVKER